MSVKNWNTRILLVSHSFFWLATNLVSPVLSIFAITNLEGVGVTEVGIASLLFFLSFGLIEPLIGVLSDAIKGFKDDVLLLVFAYVFRGLLFVGFAFASTVNHLYLFQLCLGLSRAIAGPSDKVLYSHCVTKEKEGTLWGIDEAIINLAAAIGSGLSGYLLLKYGFQNVLFLTGILTVVAGIINTSLFSHIQRQAKSPLRKIRRRRTAYFFK